ncbi:signal peptidase I [Acetivibrio cellulolyticus]|uniref:signal peptidase I n=1 Tax=Acetivibrio cellulolyticus TaxID=35830 RepID=UPI0001E2FB84|nr:signal peptidase I [Acetivibrio cellulolyticus]
MGKFEDYIGVILKQRHISKIQRAELEEEIRDHLEMIKKELIDEGYSEKQAEAIAVKRFGEAEDIKKRFRNVFTPFRMFKDAIGQKRLLVESIQWATTFVVAILVSMTIRSYAFAATEVRQCSMQSTLYEGQRLIESKIEYYYSEPQRGDIVIINDEAETGVISTFVANTKEFIDKVFKKDEKYRLIKRVIGLPGDEIDIKDGKVYINGELYNEPYVKGSTSPKDMEFPIKIPDNEYFVMGDNRENSMDSRDFGLISNDKIEGRAVLRLWPLDKVGGIYN